MFTCMWKYMDSHRNADKPYVQWHVKMHGSPQTCSQKQSKSNPKQPRAATQSSPKPPRTAQNNPSQPNHRFACISMHFYDISIRRIYKTGVLLGVFDGATHFVSIFTINLIRRPCFADPRCKAKGRPTTKRTLGPSPYREKPRIRLHPPLCPGLEGPDRPDRL